MIAVFTVSFLTTPAMAADCIDKACIDVYTQDGKIVIEGRKGSGPSQRKVVVPQKAKTPAKKPIVKKSVPPTPKGVTTKRPVVVKDRKSVVQGCALPIWTITAQSSGSAESENAY